MTNGVNGYKFGSEENGPAEYVYGDVWAREQTTGPVRLVIAPARAQIELITHLMQSMPAPYWILYVLLVSRTDAKPGRYQVPFPLEYAETENLLRRFSDFFETDARHHLWVGAEDNSDLLVYDNHNLIYAYGNISNFEQVLCREGLQQVDGIRFPCPHSHSYHPQFDSAEWEVLRSHEWKYFPLQDSDDL